MKWSRLGIRIEFSSRTTKVLWCTAGFLGVNVLIQQFYGSTTGEFFRYEFPLTVDPRKLADFYGSEEFLKVFCLTPAVENYFVRQAHFMDDGSNACTALNPLHGLPGELVSSINFRERIENFETKESPSEPDDISFFNKRERFIHQLHVFCMIPSLARYIILWDQYQNFGFYKLDDGTLKVHHYGESFYGPWPLRLAFVLHGRLVAQNTEQHLQKLLGK